MTRSKIIDKFFKLTQKDKERLRKKRVEERKKLTLAYQLGYYIGEEIVRRYLPTLSCEEITTNKIIQVRISEADERRRLDNIWYNKYSSIKGTNSERSNAAKEEWEALRTYCKMLEDKYLPKTIECSFQLLNVGRKDISDFKKGIGASLWDCDCSHYSCNTKDISVKMDKDGFFTTITLAKA